VLLQPPAGGVKAATKGIDCVWGVDVSTKSIDVAILCGDGSWQTNAIMVYDQTVATSKHGRRLNIIRERCATTAAAWAQHFPPIAVYVERPTGAHPKPILTMAAGAALMGFEEGLREAFAHPVTCFLVAVSEWKKPIVGNGNASKEMVLARARELGYEGERQDPADALCIAHFGARETGVFGHEAKAVA
jgi:Holliday junction resolvasome RuvABC endonuclease subunit